MRPPFTTFREGIILLLLGVAGYGLTCINTTLLGDDFFVIVLAPQRLASWGQQSLDPWRIIGFGFVGWGLSWSPTAYRFGMVLIHVFSALLLLRILRQLGVSARASLFWAAIFVTLPWYHEAIAWASAHCYVMSTAVFLSSLVISLDWVRHPRRPKLTFLILLVLGLLGNLIGEQLAFAFIAIPLLVTFWSSGIPRKLSDLWPKWPLLGSSAAACLYILLYALSKVSAPSPREIHLSTVLSAFFHQSASLAAYRPWWHLDQLGAVVDANVVGISACVVAALCLIAGLILFLRPWPASLPNLTTVARTSLGAQMLAGAFLLFCIVFVFAVSGGYSLDSRKRYDILLGIVIAVAPIAARLPVSVRTVRWLQIGAVLFIACNVATTNLLTEIHKTESRRACLLIQAPEVLSGDHVYRVDPYVGREALWHGIETYWEIFYDQQMLTANLQSMATPPNAKMGRVFFDLKRDRWIFQPPLE